MGGLGRCLGGVFARVRCRQRTRRGGFRWGSSGWRVARRVAGVRSTGTSCRSVQPCGFLGRVHGRGRCRSRRRVRVSSRVQRFARRAIAPPASRPGRCRKRQVSGGGQSQACRSWYCSSVRASRASRSWLSRRATAAGTPSTPCTASGRLARNGARWLGLTLSGLCLARSGCSPPTFVGYLLGARLLSGRVRPDRPGRSPGPARRRARTNRSGHQAGSGNAHIKTSPRPLFSRASQRSRCSYGSSGDFVIKLVNPTQVGHELGHPRPADQVSCKCARA